jgi:hypothetical protein
VWSVCVVVVETSNLLLDCGEKVEP